MLSIEKLTLSSEHISLLNLEVYKFKKEVYQKYYPKLDEWYWKKLVPDFYKGKRSIIVIKDNNDILGLSIIKYGVQKNKLCTFYLLPEIRHSGLSTSLLTETLNGIDLTLPINVTVPQERIFEKYRNKTIVNFFDKYNFKVLSKIPNRYRNGKDEYVLATNKLILCDSNSFEKVTIGNKPNLILDFF